MAFVDLFESTGQSSVTMSVVFNTPAGADSQSEGVLAWEDDCLVVEYERTRFFRGPAIVHADLPVEEIDSVDFRTHVFNGVLKLRALYLHTAKQVDWAKGLEIRFIIPKKEWSRAIALVESINKAIDEEMTDD